MMKKRWLLYLSFKPSVFTGIDNHTDIHKSFHFLSYLDKLLSLDRRIRRELVNKADRVQEVCMITYSHVG